MGDLENEMWRSVRLVVDTGVHAKHWSRQQMIDFFREHTAMDDQNIATEVDRYIAWPGSGAGLQTWADADPRIAGARTEGAWTRALTSAPFTMPFLARGPFRWTFSKFA